MASDTPQRRTALALVSAFNSMDIPTILSLRTPTCTRHILPTSLGIAPQTNNQYATHLNALKPIFHNFTLQMNDLLEDREAGRISMWLTARADTVVGEYVNEYMWVLDFEGGGDGEARVSKSVEFVDAVVNKEFWPKLRGAMEARRKGERAESSKGER